MASTDTPPTGPFTADEVDAAMKEALDALAVAGDEAIEQARKVGVLVVLRGQGFYFRVRNLDAQLANRLQDA